MARDFDRESFYSPWQVRTELRQLPFLGAQSTRDRPEDSRTKRSPNFRWPMETAVCIKVDLVNALEALRGISELHYAVVFGLNVPRANAGPGDKPATVTSLARELGHDWETVKRADIDGIGWMAHHLGWDGNWVSWYRPTPREGGRR